MSDPYLHYSRVLSFARMMRNNPTKAEEVFWNHSRRRNLFGLKFNRQFILRYRKNQEKMAYYIADFYNHELKLVIELDGEIHKNQIEHDLMRTEKLNSLGYKVLRFKNKQVLDNFEAVINEIEKYVLI